MHNKQNFDTNMTIKALVNPVTPFAQNAPIIFCSETNKCAFVDPGGDADFLLQIAKENNLIPEKILLTHGHADHAGAAMEIAQILNIKIEGPHKEDKFLLDSLQSQGEMFGMQARNCMPDKWLEGIRDAFCVTAFSHESSCVIQLRTCTARRSVSRPLSKATNIEADSAKPL